MFTPLVPFLFFPPSLLPPSFSPFLFLGGSVLLHRSEVLGPLPLASRVLNYRCVPLTNNCLYLLFYVYSVLPACMSVPCVHRVPLEAVGSSRAGITYCCDPPCGCWALNSCSLEERPVLITSKPLLQPLLINFLNAHWSR